MRRQGSNKANETAKIKRYCEKQRASKERTCRQEKQHTRLPIKQTKHRYKNKKRERQHKNASTFIKRPEKISKSSNENDRTQQKNLIAK